MKIYLICLLLFSSYIYCQRSVLEENTKDINIILLNFNKSERTLKSGVTMPDYTIYELNKITVSSKKKEKQNIKLKKWVMFFPKTKKSIVSDINNPSLITKAMQQEVYKCAQRQGCEVIIQNIEAIDADLGNPVKVEDFIFFVHNCKNCNEENSLNKAMPLKDVVNTTDYKGKLLMGKTGKIPLANQKVILKDSRSIEIQSTITDDNGDFIFMRVEISSSYGIEVPITNLKIKDDQLYISKQDGSNIRSLKKAGNSFVYELLSVELTKLSEEKTDDTELTLKNFTGSAKNELTITKDVYYKMNSSEITPESKLVLDGIINSMKNNKSLKLSIMSHTDSQGDDIANMVLSEKRAKIVMDYFLSKGVLKEKLTCKGLGETKIINRCKNGIDCSEEEHKLNRRTEFIFSK